MATKLLTTEDVPGVANWQDVSAVVPPSEQTLAQTLGFGDQSGGENIVMTGGGEIQSNGPLILNYDENSALQVTADGNPRGFSAIDLQKLRFNQSQVASGYGSMILGYSGNTASDFYSTAIGLNNTVSGSSAFAIGDTNTITGQSNYVIGFVNNATNTAVHSFAAGRSNTLSGNYSVGIGAFNVVSDGSVTLGRNNTTSSSDGICIGYSNTASGLSTAIGVLNTTLANSYSLAMGYGSKTSTYGENAYASGYFINTGDAKISKVCFRRVTNNAGTFELFTDGITNRYSISNTKAIKFRIQIIGKNTVTNTINGYDVTGMAKNVGGTITVLGVVVTANSGNEFAMGGTPVSVLGGATFSVNVAPNVGANTVYWVAEMTAASVLGV